MNGVTIIAEQKCNNLAELITALQRISRDGLEQTPNEFVTINDATVSVRLERQILSDGSEVYNVNIEP